MGGVLGPSLGKRRVLPWELVGGRSGALAMLCEQRKRRGVGLRVPRRDGEERGGEERGPPADLVLISQMVAGPCH